MIFLPPDVLSGTDSNTPLSLCRLTLGIPTAQRANSGDFTEIVATLARSSVPHEMVSSLESMSKGYNGGIQHGMVSPEHPRLPYFECASTPFDVHAGLPLRKQCTT